MRAPDGLGAAGKKAWTRAVRSIETDEDPDRLYDLAARYANAVDVADKARRQWRKGGSVMVVIQANGVECANPLLKVINVHDQHAHRFGQALKIEASGKRKYRGPNPQAVVQAEVGPSPAAKLRAV